MGKGKVVCEFTISNMGSLKELKQYGYATFEEAVRDVIDTEGLFGVVDDGWSIKSVRAIRVKE